MNKNKTFPKQKFTCSIDSSEGKLFSQKPGCLPLHFS